MNKSVTAYILFFVFTIYSIVFLIGCSKADISSKTYILTNNNYKYWDEVYENTGKYYGAYRLGKDGSQYWVLYNNRKGYRRYANADDVIPNNKWSLLDSNKIQLGSFKYKIILLKEDSMILFNLKLNQTDTLVKSKNQKDEQTFPPKEEETIIL